MGDISLPEKFALNAFSCSVATFVTHPIELVKTRMQLQGELTQTYKKHYSKNFASARLIAQTDGVRGLYSGLTAGITYQAIMNGTRLTLFDRFRECGVNATASGMLAGAIAGAIGSPFYLLKTQQQALSKIAVGCQHHESNRSIGSFFHSQYNVGGLRRIFHGTTAQVLRVTVGSGSQLASFVKTKEVLRPYLQHSHWFVLTASASVVASMFVCVCMSPFDVAATRIYNQPLDPKTSRGTLYTGPLDALVKIWKQEGSTAFMKGFRAGYPRHALQTILTMSLWDIMKWQYSQFCDKR